MACLLHWPKITSQCGVVHLASCFTGRVDGSKIRVIFRNGIVIVVVSVGNRVCGRTVVVSGTISVCPQIVLYGFSADHWFLYCPVFLQWLHVGLAFSNFLVAY